MRYSSYAFSLQRFYDFCFCFNFLKLQFTFNCYFQDTAFVTVISFVWCLAHGRCSANGINQSVCQYLPHFSFKAQTDILTNLRQFSPEWGRGPRVQVSLPKTYPHSVQSPRKSSPFSYTWGEAGFPHAIFHTSAGPS